MDANMASLSTFVLWFLMAALRSRCGHYILQLWFLSSSFFFLPSPILSGGRIGCLRYFFTCWGLSVNLGCRSEMCCMRLAENTLRKNNEKSPSAHHRTTLSDYISATKACMDNPKKMLNNNTSSMCPHNMVNLGLLTAEIGWWVWGTTANFNGFCILASLLHRRLSTEVNQTLHDVWPSPWLVGPTLYTVFHKKNVAVNLYANNFMKS